MTNTQAPALIVQRAQEITALTTIAPRQASERFELMANTLSDQQLKEVIDHIELPALTQITAQHDMSHPSILSELMTPEQICAVIRQQPLYWESKLKNDLEELTRFTFDFLTYLLRTQQTEARQIGIIEMLAEDESGLRYMSLPFVTLLLAEKEHEEFESEDESPSFRSYEEEDLGEADEYCRRTEYEDMLELGLDTPQSLLMLLRTLSPGVEEALRELVLELNYGLDARRLVKKLSDELVMLAKGANDTALEHELHDLDSMFSFLD